MLSCLLFAAHKARKAGREQSAHNEERVRALEEQEYRCVFGGLPLNVLFVQQNKQQKRANSVVTYAAPQPAGALPEG